MQNNKCGYVYVLSNPAMPGILKIGRSINGGRSRAVEIYKQGGTGVPMPFKMEFEAWSEDCFSSEQYVHEELADFRINESREFFRIELDEAIRTIFSVIGSDYNLTTGYTDFTITEYEMMSSYGDKCEELVSRLFPGAPIGLILCSSIARHLTEKSISEAISNYKNAIDVRKKRMDERRLLEKEEKEGLN